MDQATIRLKCLKLASQLMRDTVRPDAEYLVELAKSFEAYVLTNGKPVQQLERRPRGRPRKADNLVTDPHA